LLPEPVFAETVDEPAVAIARDDVLAGIVPAPGIERRIGQAYGFERQALAVDGVELAVEIECVLVPEPAHHAHELVHAPVARIVILRPGAIAERLEFLFPPAVHDIDRRAPAAQAIERGRELRHHLRGDDAGMDSDHQLDLAGQWRERGRQHPGRMVGAEPTFGK